MRCVGGAGVAAMMATMLAVGGCREVTTVPGGEIVFVIADPHLHAPSLGTSGPGFAAFVDAEARLVAESPAIFAELRRRIQEEHPSLLLIAGDLTSNGEFESHVLLARELAEIEAAGTSVLVVPGNHDIANPRAAAWTDAGRIPVEGMPAERFLEIYAQFGYSDALDTDAASLSYVAEPLPGLRVLALDSTAAGRGGATGLDAGRLADSTLAWAKRQIANARADGVAIIGLMHHQLVPHFDGEAANFPGFLIDGAERVRTELADAGLRLIFTGHFHATDVARGSGTASSDFIFDVSTASLVSYPCDFRLLDVQPRKVLIRTERLSPVDIDTGGAVFPVFAYQKLSQAILGQSVTLLEGYGIEPATAKRLAWLSVDALIAHRVGDETIPPDTYSTLQLSVLTGDVLQRQAAQALLSLWTDLSPADRDVLFDLATGDTY